MSDPLPQSSTLACSECGTALPSRVYEAGEILLGFQTLRPEDLVEQIAAHVKANTYQFGQSRCLNLSDDQLGRYALQDWMDGLTPDLFVQAWRHYFGGECYQAQNERIAAESEGQG